MRTFKLFLCMFIVSTMIVTFSSCKKDDKNNDNTQPTTTYNFSAKIDSSLFQANVTYMYLTNPGNSYAITINTSDENDIWRNWSLQFFSDTIGTFQFTTNFPTQGVAKGSYSQGPTGSVINYEAFSGSITVTKIDTINHKISGTFCFTGRDENNYSNTKSITEGSFTNVPKQ